MFELPPRLLGDEQTQLYALRDYLVRLAKSLEAAQNAPTALLGGALTAGWAPVLPEAALDGAAARAAQSYSNQLRALIVKTADTLDGSIAEVYRYANQISETMRSDYVAQSEFGSFQETIATTFTATAQGVVDSYNFQSQIDTLGSSLDTAFLGITSIQGEIRRGIITDLDTGVASIGIAIAERLRFTGTEYTDANGLKYYELEPGQTLGLYTSTGWQFWINGVKRGWFDSTDGMLHVMNIVAESSLQVGAAWTMTASGGFGIKYLGS